MEYSGKPGNDHCQFCHQPIGANYYRVNAAMSCASCAEKARLELGRDSAGPFGKSLFFGLGAAALGLILYAVFMIQTGISIGYATLAVGWMVGKAMLKGSGGISGRRYQASAAILTYLASTLARVPVWIHYRPEFSGMLATIIPKALIFPFTRFADDPFRGALGLVILFAGLSIAVKLTAAKPLTVDGPFDNTSQRRP